jgi:poly(3-hydroxybutyrate) depolymerase
MLCKKRRITSSACAYLFLIFVTTAAFNACSKEQESPSDNEFHSYVIRNIEYGANTDTSGTLQQLKLDLYIPVKSDTNQVFPLVVMIHGGSYLTGDKDWLSPSCEVLQNSGFVVSSIDYRLGWREPGSFYDEMTTLAHAAYRGMQDANAALRFLAAHAVEYGIDTNWIFLGGESAGASIALNGSYTTDDDIETNNPELAQKLGKLNTSGNEYAKTYTIKGICNKWGAISDSNLIYPGNAIPVISFHGVNDMLVPSEQGYFLGCETMPAYGSSCIYRRLLSAGSASVLYLKEDAGHMPVEFTPEFTMVKTAEFFNHIIRGTATSSIHYQ